MVRSVARCGAVNPQEISTDRTKAVVVLWFVLLLGVELLTPSS